MVSTRSWRSTRPLLTGGSMPGRLYFDTGVSCRDVLIDHISWLDRYSLNLSDMKHGDVNEKVSESGSVSAVHNDNKSVLGISWKNPDRNIPNIGRYCFWKIATSHIDSFHCPYKLRKGNISFTISQHWQNNLSILILKNVPCLHQIGKCLSTETH